MRNLVTDDDAIAGKLSEEEITQAKELVTESIEWIEQHSEEDKETLDSKRKELEKTFNPLMMKYYQQAPQPEGDMPDHDEL